MGQVRIPRRAVDGVLLLDKPGGLSSNHALQQARRLLNAAKAGHTGTLDPMASGLLPLTFGEATKFSQQLLDADKRYLATARLGQTTTTGDAEGEVVLERALPPSLETLPAVLAGFVGEISQIPPMYSALKRDGRPLYELARQGIEVERQPRRVVIHALDLVRSAPGEIVFEVYCSKGTYVRTLAEDIGEALGCGAHLTALRRTAIGPLSVEGAVTLEQFEACDAAIRDRRLAGPDSLVMHLPEMRLDDGEAGIILHGGAVRREADEGLEFRLYGPEGFLGLGRMDGARRLWPKRLIATGESARGK
ncbi:MAG: tRNA pseudouridine(55) synthase TruB [Rhodocyclaceae bacterium]|nr:tRNA pseudouridine(55) synthase TruB [Rhodocyclaceae bacterium]